MVLATGFGSDLFKMDLREFSLEISAIQLPAILLESQTSLSSVVYYFEITISVVIFATCSKSFDPVAAVVCSQHICFQ